MKLFVVLLASLLLVASVDGKKKVKRSVGDPVEKQSFKFRNLKDANNLDKIPVLKTPTAYDQCKMKCREERDAVAITEYIQQLKDELAAAELLETEAAAAAAAAAEVAPVEIETVAVDGNEQLVENVAEHKDLLRDVIEAHDVIREVAAQANKN